MRCSPRWYDGCPACCADTGWWHHVIHSARDELLHTLPPVTANDVEVDVRAAH